MNILSLYKAILHSVDCAVDHSPDFTIRFKLKTINEIIKSKSGKVLILPTKEILDSNTDWEQFVAFHPACESVLCGQSEILNVLLDLINSKVYRTMIDTAATIVALAQQEDVSSSLTYAQRELLGNFEFNKAAYTLLGQIAKKNTQFTGEFPLISLRLDRGGLLGETKYSRVCNIVPHFKLNEKTICGCTSSSKTAVVTIKRLFECLLPEQLAYGTNSKYQPYLVALLEGFYRCALKLNTMNKILGKYTDVPQINITWYDYMDEIQILYKQGLPQSLAGNVGDPICTTKQQPTVVEKEEYITPVAPTVRQQPSTKESLPWEDDEKPTPQTTNEQRPFTLNFPKNETPLNSRANSQQSQRSSHYRQDSRYDTRSESRRPAPNINLDLGRSNQTRHTTQPGSNYGVESPFTLASGSLPLGRRRG